MKIYVIFAQRKCRYEGEHAPEALAVVDEFSHDHNPDWLHDELAKHRTAGYEAVEIVAVDLSSEAVDQIQERLTGTTVVPGTVEAT